MEGTVDIQPIVDAVNANGEILNQIYQKINSLDFYIGVIVGVLLGLIWWNVVKGVN
jgi:uncharacterized transporter YbjL